MKNTFYQKIGIRISRLSLLLVLLLLLQTNVYSQNHYESSCAGIGVTHFKYEGYSIENSKSKGLDSNYVNGTSLPITAYFNWNIPIVGITHNSAIGINPGLTLAANTKTLGFSIPAFLTFKYGTDARLKHKGSKLGFAMGIGYAVGAYGSADYKFLFNEPQGMAEISFQTRRMVNKIRFTFATGSFTSNTKFQEGITGSSYKITNYAGLTYLMSFEK